MKKLILLICAFLTLIIFTNNYKDEFYTIPKESIRIRIVPNSNSIEDQLLKKQVKNNIELKIEQDLRNSKTLGESRTILKNNLDSYKNEVKNIINENETDETFSIDYGTHYFPEKEYKGVKYKSGMYESLLITLGNGEGDNWWCVLFPPICSLEVEDDNTSDVKYTSYVKEIYQKYIK